ncbi:hypothetical protein [Alienimonas californiensis]|uniref:Uncharacterized protein n=1 Tax=Alienimonas californiensis TaxID=2527989 RepID=A0A517PBG1_9PLAN|nr:hypothetical protein [Alienimonas californiensis]QDT16724.1 hypothetical protein CA12_28300 [Alienimonas californiensis]
MTAGGILESRWAKFALAQWLHGAAVAGALATAEFTAPWWARDEVTMVGVIPAAFVCGPPGAAALTCGYWLRTNFAVLIAVVVGFGLRLFVAVAFPAAVLWQNAANVRTALLIGLAGLLAGFSAEGLMILRPPRRTW